MSSTFNANSQPLGGDRVYPIIIVGSSSGGRKRPQENISLGEDSTHDNHHNDPSSMGEVHRGGNYCNASYIRRESPKYHRSGPPQQHGIYVSSTSGNNSEYNNEYNDSSNNNNNNRRHRHKNKDELQYAASTVHSALADAGHTIVSATTMRDSRREGLLSSHLESVDVDDCCKVVTSRVHSDDEDAIHARTDEEANFQIDNCIDYNLASMYMIAGLVQSTRHHYNFSSNDDGEANIDNAAAFGQKNSFVTADLPTKKQGRSSGPTKEGSHGINNNSTDDKSSEDNSEGLSSWTPSSRSSFHHLNYYNGKSSNIDNDNRSDGQSSDMAGGAGGGSTSSSSYSDSSDSGDDGIDDTEAITADKYNHDYDGPCTVVG
jgi:hypothetical protein